MSVAVATTTQTDVDTTDDAGPDFDPVEAFFRNLTGEKTPPEEDGQGRGAKEQGTETSASEDPEGDDETTEGTEEGQEDPAEGSKEPTKDETAQSKRDAADEDEVVVKVGDEERRVSVRDLKRLYGQEASLTRKSQEVAETRKGIEAQGQRYNAGLERMQKASEERWKAYERIDYLTARDSMTPEAFQALRSDAAKAYQEYKFFSEELDGHLKTAQQESATALRERAVSAVKELTNPDSPHYIEGWNQQVYDGLRSYAVEQGLPIEEVNSLVLPGAWKLIQKAQKYDRAQAQAAKVKVKPAVPASPKKPLTVKDSPVQVGRNQRAVSSMAKLRQTGSVDDAADAFLARWADS